MSRVRTAWGGRGRGRGLSGKALERLEARCLSFTISFLLKSSRSCAMVSVEGAPAAPHQGRKSSPTDRAWTDPHGSFRARSVFFCIRENTSVSICRVPDSHRGRPPLRRAGLAGEAGCGRIAASRESRRPVPAHPARAAGGGRGGTQAEEVVAPDGGGVAPRRRRWQNPQRKGRKSRKPCRLQGLASPEPA
jgi:hypothetical protein